MSKLLKLNLIVLGLAGLILAGTFSDSVISKVKAAITSTNFIGYAWSDNIGWISFSSANGVVETEPEVIDTPCVADSPLVRTLACPSGQTGSITQERTSTCPGPITSDWATVSNSCSTVKTITSQLGKSCTSFCGDSALSCLSVGTDAGGTNGKKNTYASFTGRFGTSYFYCRDGAWTTAANCNTLSSITPVGVGIADCGTASLQMNCRCGN